MLVFLKKLASLQLHTKILLALVIGALFGALFNVDQHRVQIEYGPDIDVKTVDIRGWEQIVVHVADRTTVFGPNDQVPLIRKFDRLKPSERHQAIIEVTYEETDGSVAIASYENIHSVHTVKTAATAIRPVGTVFIRLLTFIAIPLVLSSLIVGAASLSDLSKIARIGAKTITYYVLTTSVAITIGLVVANIIQPGIRMAAEPRERLMVEYQEDVQSRIDQVIEVNIVDQMVNMIPTNPLNAIAQGEMLQIVFFGVVFGLLLTAIAREKAEPVIKIFEGVMDAMIKLVEVVMKIAPYGVFALIAATVGEFGFDILGTLLWYIAAVILGLFLHMSLTYSILLKSLSKMPVIRFLKEMRPVQLIAFSTSSSAATLPLNMKVSENNLGCSKETTSFILPLGATINMDGTALYQGVAAMFIAQVYGFDLNIAQQLTIVLTATLASIGTAPVPGVGIIMLIIVLKAVGIPEEGVALILGVDRILDMIRTLTNVTGDAAANVIISESEGQRNIEVTA
jgi:proton glutamate symport protein